MPSFCKPDHLSSPVGLISKIFHYHVLTQPAAIGQARRIAAQSFCFAILLFSQLRIVHLSSNFWPSQQDPNFCGLDVHRFPYSNNPKHCQSASGHHFNPRTCVRCDVMPPINARSLYDFNPRTYLRCDHTNITAYLAPGYFNPRTYIRCDSAPNEPAPSKGSGLQKCESRKRLS